MKTNASPDFTDGRDREAIQRRLKIFLITKSEKEN